MFFFPVSPHFLSSSTLPLPLSSSPPSLPPLPLFSSSPPIPLSSSLSTGLHETLALLTSQLRPDANHKEDMVFLKDVFSEKSLGYLMKVTTEGNIVAVDVRMTG